MRSFLNKLLYSGLLIGLPVLVAQGDQPALVQRVITATCDSESHTKIARFMNLGVAAYSDVVVNRNPIGWRATLTNADDRFELQRLAPGGKLKGARLEWYKNEKAQMSISVDVPYPASGWLRRRSSRSRPVAG